jgi:hypothetical protein
MVSQPLERPQPSLSPPPSAQARAPSSPSLGERRQNEPDQRPDRRSTGSARLIHDARPDRTSASCAGHSRAARWSVSAVRYHAIEPRFVHGVCQVVCDSMSLQTTFLPALHMPVNSRHRLQNPSCKATGSSVRNPQSGQAQPRLPWRPRRPPKPRPGRPALSLLWLRGSRAGTAPNTLTVLLAMRLAPLCHPALPLRNPVLRDTVSAADSPARHMKDVDGYVIAASLISI